MKNLSPTASVEELESLCLSAAKRGETSVRIKPPEASLTSEIISLGLKLINPNYTHSYVWVSWDFANCGLGLTLKTVALATQKKYMNEIIKQLLQQKKLWLRDSVLFNESELERVLEAKGFTYSSSFVFNWVYIKLKKI